ncbi:hypothetical protein GJAV_G00070740 [Gymnothorax javanicus]|nr:hypothetical protein GJAV_G00070740 [Gymnothorax javanicus]
MRNKLSKEMASYIVRIEPKPIDSVYIQVEGKKYHDGETIELNGAPKEITIHRESAWHRSFTTWRCRYVTITSSDTEKEYYYPVFREIHSAGWTVKENSAKLPHEEPSAEREDSLRKNKEFRDSIDQHGKESVESPQRDIEFRAASLGKKILGKGGISPVPQAVPVVSADPREKIHKYRFLSFLLRLINIIPEPLHFAQITGLPGFVKGGNFFALPKELWFETRKLITLLHNILQAIAETIFRRLWNCCRKWRKIDDIGNVFWFTSKKAKYISQHWRNDAFFGKQVLNGCNPIMIKRYSVGKEQKIPLATLEKVYPNIKENIKNGNIYEVDYEILDGIKEDVSPTSPSTYLAAPIMLLQQMGNDLKPIAIQLKQRPGVDNPIFTPEDKPVEAWLLAKMWVRNSDFYYHELVSHLLRAHLMGEIFFIASQSLADQHPMARLIRTTGRYTLPINITARNTLVNKGGFFTEYTAIADGEQWEILKRAGQEITYESLCLPDNLEDRGVNDLKNYYYRDDAKRIWDAIQRFVHDVVIAVYKDDEEVSKDPELQDMVYFIYSHGFLRKSGCPSHLKTREETIKYITMIMFTCSAQHAAVNHGQYDTYAWMPNGPSTMRKPPPTNKDVTESDIMDTLPGIGVTLETMKVTKFLSQVPNDFVPLGQYPEEVVGERYMTDAVYKFQKELKEIGEEIEKRSKSQEFPYEYLLPAGMENSITI